MALGFISKLFVLQHLLIIEMVFKNNYVRNINKMKHKILTTEGKIIDFFYTLQGEINITVDLVTIKARQAIHLSIPGISCLPGREQMLSSTKRKQNKT